MTSLPSAQEPEARISRHNVKMSEVVRGDRRFVYVALPDPASLQPFSATNNLRQQGVRGVYVSVVDGNCIGETSRSGRFGSQGAVQSAIRVRARETTSSTDARSTRRSPCASTLRLFELSLRHGRACSPPRTDAWSLIRARQIRPGHGRCSFIASCSAAGGLA